MSNIINTIKKDKTLMELWHSLIKHLSLSLDSGFSRPLLKRIHFKECQNDHLYILIAEDTFSKGWFENNCLPLIYEYLNQKNLHKDFRIEINTLINKTENLDNSLIDKKEFSTTTPIKKTEHHLAVEFTFDYFIPGDCNDFPYQAARNISKENISMYNPFIITGNIGTGKTHLAQAIVSHFESLYPQKKTIYITSEEFTNEFIKHIQNKNMNIFREKYRNCDLLVMDDIQGLQNRDSTTDELENTFNDLISKGTQMVFTCDKNIEKLKGLNPRLRTRLSGGLSVSLKTPGFETRKAILLDMIQRENYKVDHKVLDLIAEVVDDNIRSLKGTLIKIFAYADLKKKDISLKLAKEILSDKIKIDIPSDLTINQIQKAVSHFFGIKISDIKSSSKLNAIAYPRQIAMYIASKHTNFTSTEIGSLFGKSHSTVLRSTQKIESQLSKSANLKKQVEKIMLELSDIYH